MREEIINYRKNEKTLRKFPFDLVFFFHRKIKTRDAFVSVCVGVGVSVGVGMFVLYLYSFFLEH